MTCERADCTSRCRSAARPGGRQPRAARHVAALAHHLLFCEQSTHVRELSDGQHAKVTFYLEMLLIAIPVGPSHSPYLATAISIGSSRCGSDPGQGLRDDVHQKMSAVVLRFYHGFPQESGTQAPYTFNLRLARRPYRVVYGSCRGSIAFGVLIRHP